MVITAISGPSLTLRPDPGWASGISDGARQNKRRNFNIWDVCAIDKCGRFDMQRGTCEYSVSTYAFALYVARYMSLRA